MTPRLLLLTGPAAVEAAQVFSDDCHCCCPEGDPHRTWDEVRDYLEIPRQAHRKLVGVRSDYVPKHDAERRLCDQRAAEVEAALRSLPGGEAWLVGLVLPEVPKRASLQDVAITSKPKLERFGSLAGLPARLAILAPEPPPLLVERVRAWGGEVWECLPDVYRGMYCKILRHHQPGTKPLDNPWVNADTWLEAVRAALGEQC